MVPFAFVLVFECIHNGKVLLAGFVLSRCVCSITLRAETWLEFALRFVWRRALRHCCNYSSARCIHASILSIVEVASIVGVAIVEAAVIRIAIVRIV